MSYHYKKNLFLKEMFPKQFDTVPHIIIWTIVFLLDVAAVFGMAYLLDIPLQTGTWYKAVFILYMVIAFALFCLESWVYNKIKQ